MPPKRLRQRLKNPLQGPNPALALARLMNFAVTARNQVLEVTTGRRFGGERADPREVRGRALKEQMKLAKLIEGHAQVRIFLQLVEQALELSPVRPLGGDETLQINDHLKSFASVLH